MRLKQLLGVTLLVVACATAAAAAATQLTDLNVAANGNVSTVTFRANGGFTHNEYRPTDNLLLVDMAGVAPAHFAGAMKDVHVPGINSYHVLNYKGTGGAEVTRVELELLPGSLVNVADVQGGLAVRITANAFTPAATSPKPAPAVEMPATTAPIAAKTAPAPAKAEQAEKPQPVIMMASGRTVTIEKIAVLRGKDGPEVEVTGSGAMTQKAMKLSSPDRVVLDVMNAVPARKTQQIAVNSGDIKAVRMARFQEAPPITRIVVDLVASRDYEVVPAGNKLVLKLHGASDTASAKPATTPAATPSATSSANQATPIVLAQNITAPMLIPASSNTAPVLAPVQMKMPATPAKDFVFVEPSYHPKGGEAEPTQETAMPSQVNQVKPPLAAADAAARLRNDDAPPANNLQASPAMHPAVNAAMQQAANAAAPPQASRRRYTGEVLSVNLKDVDLKDFFRLIHEISGLNIVLDPNVHGTLTLVLDDVPWDQALDIVLQNNGLDKQLEGNVLRIATVETLRREAEAGAATAKAQALAVPTVTYTHYLSYAQSKDVMPTIKKFLSERGDVIADPRTNALIIQDIPAIIPKVQTLLIQLDRKTQEVEIEARVVAATRNFARDIGTQLGFGWGNGVNTAVGGASAVGTSPAIVAGLVPKYFTLGNSIPLFSNTPAVGPNSGITITNATNNYRLDFILTAAESRGLLKVLSRPRVVTQNNIQAVVRQGSQIPVVTAAQLGGPPTVTYVQAFLRLTVTPQITAENTIFLNVDVENTTPDFGHAISGNPTLLTQNAVTQVLVNDGGTVVIGGVIQTQNSINFNEVPLLGSIPILGNLFKRRAVSTTTQELIFFITPKIIQM